MSQRQWVEPMTVAHSFPRERGRWEQATEQGWSGEVQGLQKRRGRRA